MRNEIQNAFEKILAEDALKEKTANYLIAEIQKRTNLNKSFQMLRLNVVFVCIATLIFIGTLSYNLYFTPSAFIDIDVNPSIELIVNRFDRVIKSGAYNSIGDDILKSINVNNKSYNEAIDSLIKVIEEKGYLADDSLISLTLQTGDKNRENIMLANLNNNIHSLLQEHHHSVQASVFTVTEEIRVDAHNNHISPAKYLAILELQKVDSTVTIETCRGHSISELKQLTQKHGARHHGENTSDESSDVEKQSDDQIKTNNTNHGNGKKYGRGMNRHH